MIIKYLDDTFFNNFSFYSLTNTDLVFTENSKSQNNDSL